MKRRSDARVRELGCLLALLALRAGPALAEEATPDLPDSAAQRRQLVEPLDGAAPSPWIALAAAYDMGVAIDGATSWTAVRVRFPVARRYGGVDARLVATWGGEGLDQIGPEITLRGVPLRLAGGRGALGFSISVFPQMHGTEPLLTLGGGLMGGYLGRLWFVRAFAGARGEVLERLGGVEILGTVAAGLRLPHGLRPQVEIDVAGEARRSGDVALVVRPGLRWWPVEWLGVGVSADVQALGQPIETSAIRLDLVAHPIE
jgi:hypothetical protein